MKQCFFGLLRQYRTSFVGFFMFQVVLSGLCLWHSGFINVHYLLPYYFFTVVAYSIPSKLTGCLALGSSRKELFGGCSLFFGFSLILAVFTFYFMFSEMLIMQVIIHGFPLGFLQLPMLSHCIEQFKTYFLLMLPSFFVGIYLPKKSNVNPWLVGMLLLVSYGCIYNFGTTFSDLSTGIVALVSVLLFCITEALLWVETKKLTISN